MGASSPEIERQIAQTRQHLDANLSVLEHRAASTAKRVTRIAVAIGLGVAAAAAAGFAVFRLVRRR